jgi:hypothetical protein
MQQEQLWTLPEQFGRIDVGGFKVEAVDGRVGKVEQSTLERGSSHLIIDTGPPLLGKKLLLPSGLVSGIDRDEEIVRVACTEDELKNAPAFDAERQNDPVYRDQVAAYYAAGADPRTDSPDKAGGEPGDR